MAIWIGFIALIFTFLALDLGVFHRKNEVVSTQSALRWTALWVTMALSFSIFVYYAYSNGWVANPGGLTGREAVVLYITGYLIEESLSMDNIFVIALIFTYFMVPKEYQHRVLFWGILGALVFRGLMIGIGAALVQRFDWMVYVFGVLLIYSAYKMLRSGEEDINPGKNPVLRIIEWPAEDQSPAAQQERVRQTFKALYPDAEHRPDSSRHPGMHETATIDYALVLEGEIVALMDEGEKVMRAGDVLIQRGTMHAWANRSGAPVKMAFILVDAS